MAEVPQSIQEEARRLTRLARQAVDENEARAYRERRDDVLAEHGFAARVREDPGGGETLVLYPEEWLDEEGTVDLGAVEDVDRGIELHLSGRGAQGDYQDADERNRELVERVRETAGEVHAANAAIFADFMSNHYARPMPSATETELREFLEQYYPRNAWPTDEQAAVVERSLAIVFDVADEGYPLENRR